MENKEVLSEETFQGEEDQIHAEEETIINDDFSKKTYTQEEVNELMKRKLAEVKASYKPKFDEIEERERKALLSIEKYSEYPEEEKQSLMEKEEKIKELKSKINKQNTLKENEDFLVKEFESQGRKYSPEIGELLLDKYNNQEDLREHLNELIKFSNEYASEEIFRKTGVKIDFSKPNPSVVKPEEPVKSFQEKHLESIELRGRYKKLKNGNVL